MKGRRIKLEQQWKIENEARLGKELESNKINKLLLLQNKPLRPSLLPQWQIDNKLHCRKLQKEVKKEKKKMERIEKTNLFSCLFELGDKSYNVIE